MVYDGLFQDRAVESFLEAAKENRLSPRHLNDILKYKDRGVDVTPIEPLLLSEEAWVRKLAAKVIGKVGNVEKVIEAAKIEKDKSVLLEMLQQIVETKQGLEQLVYMIDCNTDTAIRTAAINMFKRVGRADCLTSLLFDKDDDLVNRIKIWMEQFDEEEENKGKII